jgi:hypothetical protein
MPKWLRNNGLSITMFLLFAISLVGQLYAGHRHHNADQLEHGQPSVSLSEYVRSGHFVEAVFENWESEFLQMAAFVIFTAFLYQKGSPESRKLGGEPDLDKDPRRAKTEKSPWPVHKGGLVLKLYEHSLSMALFLLFAISFFLHAAGGAKEYNQEQMEHGSASSMSTLDYIRTSRFWFESFQNWQSEFLSVGVLIVLSIFLRERHSTESKPVADPHYETGS